MSNQTDSENSVAVAIEGARAWAQIVNRGKGGREIALAITKLEEAQQWLRAAREAIDKEQ